MENNINYLTSLEKIIVAYEEIAAQRLQKIKDGVLQNRIFLNGVNQIFQIVRYSYQKEAAKYRGLIKETKKNKTALVLLSANTGLHGELIQKIFEAFKANLTPKTEAVIIGRLGKNLAEISLKTKFAYFDFPDAKFDVTAAKKILDHLLPFKKVVVYHGVFKNILRQESQGTDITGTANLPPVKIPKKRRLIFEPSLGQILDFFETEVFASLLVHTFFEAQLAKFSARMSTLNQAGGKIKMVIEKARQEERNRQHRLANKKQLESLVALKFLSAPGAALDAASRSGGGNKKT